VREVQVSQRQERPAAAAPAPPPGHYGRVTSIQTLRSEAKSTGTGAVIGYRVNVQLDNGQTRSVTVNSLDGLGKGDRVRYADGHLFHA
jgi:hypothetical protein